MAKHPAVSPLTGFCIGRDEPVPAAVLRIAREQLTAAIVAARDTGQPEDGRIHNVRKNCKRLRALLRLIRSQDEEIYASENAAVRDAARELSGLRDTDAILAACTALIATCRIPLVRAQLARVREKLLLRLGKAAAERETGERRLARFAARLRAARQRLTYWSVTTSSPVDLEAAFVESYRRARRAMRRAMAEPLEENFHEWRKRVKAYGYHLRLFQDIWPDAGHDRWAEVDRLSGLLGDERDVAMLAHVVVGGMEYVRLTREQCALIEFIDQRRVKLLAAAIDLGERLLTARPALLLDRLGGGRRAA
jgi:CHAD domain-containing protein